MEQDEPIIERYDKLHNLAEYFPFKMLRRKSLCCAAMDELDDETIERLLKSYEGCSFMDVRNAEDIIKQHANIEITDEKEYVSDFVKVNTVEYDFRRYVILRVSVEEQERVFIMARLPIDLAAIVVLENPMIFNSKTIDFAEKRLDDEIQRFAANKILYIEN